MFRKPPNNFFFILYSGAVRPISCDCERIFPALPDQSPFLDSLTIPVVLVENSLPPLCLFSSYNVSWVNPFQLSYSIHQIGTTYSFSKEDSFIMLYFLVFPNTGNTIHASSVCVVILHSIHILSQYIIKHVGAEINYTTELRITCSS